MENTHVTTGHVRDNRTVVLDEPLSDTRGPVRVVLEPISNRNVRPYMQVMNEIRARQAERGHKPRPTHMIDAYLKAERDSWDDEG